MRTALALLACLILAGCTSTPPLEVESEKRPGVTSSLHVRQPQELSESGEPMQPSGQYDQAFAGPAERDLAQGEVEGAAPGVAEGAMGEDSPPEAEGPESPQNEPDGAYLQATQAREDTEWGAGRIYVKAAIPGVHYNLNQPAKSWDSSADSWSLVFHLEAPFRAEDQLWICGPQESFGFQVYDAQQDLLLYDDLVTEVQPCE